jgi:hypothetical protein
MNPSDSPVPHEEANRTETLDDGYLIEINQTDPGVDSTIPDMTPEEWMRRRPSWLIEEYLAGGYFGEEPARIAREELDRRKKQPPATS